ncbi:MAG: DUF2442 domain-containing protein [Acidobacteriaceae bacterium]
MLHPDVRDTMDDIDAALAAAKLEPPEPMLVDAAYHRELDLFIFTIDDGRRLAIPREDIWAVRNATPEQAADMEIGPNRVNVWWPQVDEGLYLPDTLEGRYGSRAWMDRVHRRNAVAA